MRSSRLLSVSLVIGIAAGVTIIACGGGGGGGGKTPDAKVFNDAKVFMDGAAGANGIGKDCTGSGSGNAQLCPTTDAICVTLNGTKFFCTKSCGTGGSNTPPTGGNATCMMAEMSSGTPLCALVGQGSGSAYPWACGVGCGTYMGSNLGTCPSNLTCTSNICQ